MKKIDGVAKSVADLLRGKRYKIDYYQREYKWKSKQIEELVSDLTSRFLDEFDESHERRAVAGYPYYFLGSIIISEKGGERFVVDGQQRMTSLTLLLTYLHRVAQGRPGVAKIDDLIFSEQYNEKSFNLDVPDRRPCMEALFAGEPFDTTDAPESVQALVGRFEDVGGVFPDDLAGVALPYFVDWLINNVQVVEITAYSDDDAYGIFETQNDRGLKLTPADMLKGYLLANVADGAPRDEANELWRDRVRELAAIEDDLDADFLKTWLRSQYADKIRERKKAAVAEDWDRIGTEFHRWVRENRERVGLTTAPAFRSFITRDFDFYSRRYEQVVKAETSLDPEPGLEFVGFNADHGFTLQDQLLLAPLVPGDSAEQVRAKLELVGRFVDITLNRRIWNLRSIAYSTMQYAMFLVMRDIRRASAEDLAGLLHRALAQQAETFAPNDRNVGLGVHQQNRYQLHRVLARLTDYVGVQSGEATRYVEYVNGRKVRYEVEHVWANHAEQHEDEFSNPRDFAERRNLIGGLLLLPKSFNASYGDDPYGTKVEHYLSQNLLARSLHPQCYTKNPGFVRFVSQSGLPFRPYERFTADAIVERGELYRQLAERVWDPDDLLRVAEGVG